MGGVTGRGKGRFGGRGGSVVGFTPFFFTWAGSGGVERGVGVFLPALVSLTSLVSVSRLSFKMAVSASASISWGLTKHATVLCRMSSLACVTMTRASTSTHLLSANSAVTDQLLARLFLVETCSL